MMRTFTEGIIPDNQPVVWEPGEYSRHRFFCTISDYKTNTIFDYKTNPIPHEWVDVLWNYYVHGYQPGGFFISLLANDMTGAIAMSHPSNTISSLRCIALWLIDYGMRGVAWGDYATVHRWMDLPQYARLEHMVKRGLIFDEPTEVWKILKGDESHLPSVDWKF